MHALRHSFGTLLSKGGVAPRTAQAAMRHSSIDLTMNVYTDPQLLDVAGAVESLPDLPLEAGDKTGQEKATGTDRPAAPLAPTLAPTSDISCKSPSIPDNSPMHTRSGICHNSFGIRPKNAGKPRGRLERAKGFEPSTFSLGS